MIHHVERNAFNEEASEKRKLKCSHFKVESSCQLSLFLAETLGIAGNEQARLTDCSFGRQTLPLVITKKVERKIFLPKNGNDENFLRAL